MLTTLQLASCLQLPSNFGSAAGQLWDTDSLGSSPWAGAAAEESAALQDSSTNASTPQHAMQTSSAFPCSTAGQQQHGGMFLQQCSAEPSCNTGGSPQLQHGFGADSLMPVVLQDGSVVSVLPQHLSADFPMQLQDMQQQQQASTAAPVVLQDGSIVLLSSGQQQAGTQVGSAAPIFLPQQAPAQQQHQAPQPQVVVISQGMCAQGTSSSAAGQQPLIVLQGNTGSQQMPVSCGPFDQPQLLQLPAQQQQQPQHQQQVYLLAPGEQLVCTSGPMQHQQVLIAGSSGASTLQLLGSCSAQAGSCAGAQQQQQQQVVLRADPAGASTQQQLQLQGISGQHVLVCTQGGSSQIMQGQVLQVQGSIMQGTVVMQGSNAAVLPAVNRDSGGMCFSSGQAPDHHTAGSRSFLPAASGANIGHYSTGSDSGSNISSPTQRGAPARAASAGAIRACVQQQGPSCMRPPSAGQAGGGSSSNTTAKGGSNWPPHNISEGGLLGTAPGNAGSSSAANTNPGSNRSTAGRVSAAAMHGSFRSWDSPQRMWGKGGGMGAGGPNKSPKQGGGGGGPMAGAYGALPTIKRQHGRNSQLPKQPAQGLARVGQAGGGPTPTGSSATPATAAGPGSPAGAGAPSSSSSSSAPRGPLPAWATATVEDGLPQLWSGEQLARARGGCMFNIQQLAWHPADDPAPGPADLYNFQKLKRIIQKLDAMHKVRAQLIKRIHAVAESAGGDLKAVYRDVRGLIGMMLQEASMQIKSLSECRVVGLIRLALMLQVALEQGPEPTLNAAEATDDAATPAAAEAEAPTGADAGAQPRSQGAADAASAAEADGPAGADVGTGAQPRSQGDADAAAAAEGGPASPGVSAAAADVTAACAAAGNH